MEQYTGNREPFIFVYRTEEDANETAHILEALAKEHRLYIASEFSKREKKLLSKAAAVLVFLSTHHTETSEAVVSFASKENKEIVPVYLEEVTLKPGTQFLLQSIQGVMRANYADETGVREAVLSSPVFKDLRVTKAQADAARNRMILSGLAAAAVILFVLFTVLNSFSSYEISADSELGRMGITGNTADIREVYLYGSEMRQSLEPYGAQSADALNEEGNTSIYLPESDTTLVRGSLRNTGAFQDLHNLEHLALSGNSVEDVSSLWKLKKLKELDLSCNQSPVHLDGISALKKLEYLNLAYCELEGDLNELKSLSALKTLVISQEYEEALGEDVPFEVICPYRTVRTWQELKDASETDYVYRITAEGRPFIIPRGETLVIRPHVKFEAARNSVIRNYGTVEIYGTWECGLSTRNNYGIVLIKDGGVYSGGMEESRNYGTFTIEEGGILEADRGSQFYQERGTLTINGLLEIIGGGVEWNGGEVVNNGTIRIHGTKQRLDALMHERTEEIQGNGAIEYSSESEEIDSGGIAEAGVYDDLPNDPNDVNRLDEYGMTPREHAYFEDFHYFYPVVGGGGSVERPVVPYVDGNALIAASPSASEAYLARTMTVDHFPSWAYGFAEFFIAPGATVTFRGDDWNTDIAITVLKGGTLIIDGDVKFQMGFNFGTMIVNGSLIGTEEDWGRFGNAGSITVNGTFRPSGYYRFAGSEETGTIKAGFVSDHSDMEPPFQFAHGYHGFMDYVHAVEDDREQNMWWLKEDTEKTE